MSNEHPSGNAGTPGNADVRVGSSPRIADVDVGVPRSVGVPKGGDSGGE